MPPRHHGRVPPSVTVWAVDLVPGSTLEEVKGSLTLADDALVFTPNDEHRPERRYGLTDLARVRRLRGSPVLSIVFETPQGSKRVAFYFVQPPPLEPPDETRREGLGPLGRTTKRKVRRQNVSYLGFANREKREVLREWERRVHAAVKATRGSARND
jgi:hypothetical protein